MTLKFTKMHGLGNDFIVIDAINQKVELSKKEIIQLADRHLGIGFDQCLLIEPAHSKLHDFNYRIFNADGQEVGQCGNGARCLALFAKHYGLTQKDKLKIATPTTEMEVSINPDRSITVCMGYPKFDPEDIPLLNQVQAESYHDVSVTGDKISFHALSIGNPHAIILVDDVSKAPVGSLGKELCHHPMFPEQCNISFMELVDKQRIKLRVYERGAGETKACGSGATAAAAVAHLYHHLNSSITIDLLGGQLIVDWPDTKEPIYLTGPAEFVFEGRIPV